MKTRNLIIGAAVMAVITLNVNASETLRSPRATANLDRIAASTVDSRNLATENRGFMGSPRALANVANIQSVASAGVNLAALNRDVIASPRGAETFPKAVAANGVCVKACCPKN